MRTGRAPGPPDKGRTRGPRSMLVRSSLSGLGVLLAYFCLPFTSAFTASTVLVLTGGLVVVAGLLVRQIRAIKVSPAPRAQAFGTLALTVPVFVVVFSLTYHLMSRAAPEHWSEPLSRLDAFYFTVTVIATVGFGDITAVSQAARAVVTVQMIGNLLLVGLIARVIMGAVQEGLARRGSAAD
ncbi:metal transporter [Kocuria turfanensis]|uniref:Metal transporter n=1 Tax=Kocuria turfanensis TaxID=388357 RepID=A0A512I992_9MICC|nr:metal transporter [Kocuria turfanensis]